MEPFFWSRKGTLVSKEDKSRKNVQICLPDQLILREFIYQKRDRRSCLLTGWQERQILRVFHAIMALQRLHVSLRGHHHEFELVTSTGNWSDELASSVCVRSWKAGSQPPLSRFWRHNLKDNLRTWLSVGYTSKRVQFLYYKRSANQPDERDAQGKVCRKGRAFLSCLPPFGTFPVISNLKALWALSFRFFK